jgi:hypothetical protein
MKLDGKVTPVMSNMGLDGQDATIDKENMGKLWGFLQDPYKNSIGAIVREYVSNCFDAHAEANFIKNSSLTEIRVEYPIYNDVPDQEIMELKSHLQIFNNDAVFISIEKDDTGTYWKAEDFGVGLSPQRVTDVFCSYLKSTKESTNNLIGAFGIGSKSGLSYVDLFFIRTRYNGTEYNYILRKGEEAPRMEVLGSQPTEERNGTEIKIYIKDYSDENKFIEECQKQLAYFDNVYFGPNLNIDNDYTILQGQNWIKSSNGIPFDGLHLCLGKVAYPIDWDNLGIEKVNVDLALKFEIGELDIIQTREDVRYTSKTKKAIVDKISLLQEEVISKWEKEEQYKIYDFVEYFNKKSDSPFVTFKSSSNNFEVDIKLSRLLPRDDYEGWKFMPFEEVGLSLPIGKKINEYFFEYYVPSQITQAGLRKLSYNPNVYDVINGEYWRFRNHIRYRISGDHNPKKSKYICQEYENSPIVLIRKYTKTRLSRYIKELNLDENEKHLWRKQITVFQKTIQKIIVDKTNSYNKIEVDQEWLKAQYNPRAAIDRKKFVVTLRNNSSYRWENTKWIKGEIDDSSNLLFVMGIKEQQNELFTIGNFFDAMYPGKLYMAGDNTNSYLRVGYVAPTNLQYLENVKNLITVANFRKSKPFQRAMTTYHLRNNPKYEKVIRIAEMYDEEVWDNVYEPISGLMKKAHEYFKTNSVYKQKKDFRGNSFIEQGYEMVKELDAFDSDFIELLDLIDEYLVNIPFIDSFYQMLEHNIEYSLTKVTKEFNQKLSYEIVKAIVMHNCYMPKKQKKKINGYYHALLNSNEMSWLSAEDKEFIKYIQRPKLKYL